MCSNDSFHGRLKSDIKTERNVRTHTQTHTQWPPFSLCLEGLQGWLRVATIMSAPQLLCCLGQAACVCVCICPRLWLCVSHEKGPPSDTVTHDPSPPLTRGTGLISLHNPRYKWLISCLSLFLTSVNTHWFMPVKLPVQWGVTHDPNVNNRGSCTTRIKDPELKPNC